jgi:alkanesulfonate monooxygenase SsuD/methylene tetrahydromethanopterin reductase-like flavin-dependent oxidoreductase (luciferase family)
MAFTMMMQGQFIRIPTVETALRFFREENAATQAVTRRRRWILGSPDTVRRDLAALAEEYTADEVMIVTITHDHAARRRSYELIAEAFRHDAREPSPRTATMQTP